MVVYLYHGLEEFTLLVGFREHFKTIYFKNQHKKKLPNHGVFLLVVLVTLLNYY